MFVPQVKKKLGTICPSSRDRFVQWVVLSMGCFLLGRIVQGRFVRGRIVMGTLPLIAFLVFSWRLRFQFVDFEFNIMFVT
jgi:hypothetical protein